MKRIKDLSILDRPREKLIRKGSKSLSEFELLEVIIGSGNGAQTVEQLASKVQATLKRDVGVLTIESLVKIKGLSTAKVSQILAAIELAHRYVINADKPLRDTDDYACAFGDIASKQQEYLVVLSLDGARRLIARRVITVGLLDSVSVHPREVFADAIADRAAAVVIGHNHPSGEIRPSHFDIGFNQQLAAASRIIGIEMIDHLIVSKRGRYSFKEEGLL
jgi:DNA repair protein RadC